MFVQDLPISLDSNLCKFIILLLFGYNLIVQWHQVINQQIFFAECRIFSYA
jgi:hypothetical protein